MKIAFTTKGETWDAAMEARFGRTDFLFIYDEEENAVSIHNNSSVKEMEHGAGPQLAQKLFDLGVQILITGNGPGGNAAKVLEQIGIKSYIGAGDFTVKEAYTAYQNNTLEIMQ